MSQPHHDRPRPDDSPPRLQIIVGYSIFAILCLVGLKFGFDSYLDTSRIAVRRLHLAGSHTVASLEEYRDEQRSKLGGGAMPVERAIQELGRRGRGGFPLIRPVESTDLDPLRGWSQLPREVPASALPPPPMPEPVVTSADAAAMPAGAASAVAGVVVPAVAPAPAIAAPAAVP